MKALNVHRRGFLSGAAALTGLGLLGAKGTVFAGDQGASVNVQTGAAVKGKLSSQVVEPWMEGFPPPPERIIQFKDGTYRQWPQLRWTMCNLQQLVPTKTIWNGGGYPAPYVSRAVNVENIQVTTLGGETLSFQENIDKSYTDGLAVLHKGKLIYEGYFAHCQPNTRHVIQSATKSVVGTIAADLVEANQLDRDKLVPHYIPELAGSAWDRATVGNVLDMQVSMAFDENYMDPNSEVYQYLVSAGMIEKSEGISAPESVYQYLPTIKGMGEHGKAFAYREPNINVLGWLLRRVTGSSLAELCSERIWKPMNAEQDAYFMVDGWGAETSMGMTLRDFARFGELIRNEGRVDRRQVLQRTAIEKLFQGGSQEKFAKAGRKTLRDWSYTNQWWVRHLADRRCLMARGAYGQFVYIDRSAEVVVARFGSSQYPPSSRLDNYTLPLIDKLIEFLT